MTSRAAIASAYLQIPPDDPLIARWLDVWSERRSELFEAVPTKAVLFCASRSGSEYLGDLLRPYDLSIEEHMNRAAPVASDSYTPVESDAD